MFNPTNTTEQHSFKYYKANNIQQCSSITNQTNQRNNQNRNPKHNLKMSNDRRRKKTYWQRARETEKQQWWSVGASRRRERGRRVALGAMLREGREVEDTRHLGSRAKE
jgi:hypothetical protein